MEDPKTFNEAISFRQSFNWLSDTVDVFKSMQKTGVWELVDVLPTTKPMDYKSIFETKRDSNCKAVLIARDFIHTEKDLVSMEISPIFIWNYQDLVCKLKKSI